VSGVEDEDEQSASVLLQDLALASRLEKGACPQQDAGMKRPGGRESAAAVGRASELSEAPPRAPLLYEIGEP
jgi:hypothetical protein